LYEEGGGLFLASLDKPEDSSRRLADVRGQFALIPGSTGSFVAQMQANGDMDVLPFDARSGVITGAPMTQAGGTAAFNPSASHNGILLRLRGVQLHQTAVWLNREGMRLGDLGVVEGYASVSLSPNAARLVTIDLARGTTTKLAQRVKPEGTAVWAPDGASVVFTARDKNGVQRMYRADASNTRPESVLLDEPGLHWPNDWSREVLAIWFR